ncbi:DUF4127 family protein [Pseudalkalibacillus hwajinpoensis]|uniref:DUF4127 family protein n=1 Tax=Guptibacillus hwajinpoensis TaxID=208199 RepID=UPI00384C3E47
MRKIALLPVDGRPVTRKLPIDLAQLAGWEVITPEPEELGFLKKPADVDFLKRWLYGVAQQVDGIVLSIDLLLYGGLVPSRIHSYTNDELIVRLNLLKELKETYPSLKIMVFSSTMRLSNNNVNEEEKEYWQDYGTMIWALSYHEHRYEVLGQNSDAQIVKEMNEKIPETVLEDYKKSRGINYSVNKFLVTLVNKGLIDHLVFPQDDTSEYGWNVKEQKELAALVQNQNLEESVYLYPGADEVSSTLVTRMIFECEQEEVPTFFPVYSGLKGALSPALYEDRPIMESVKGQLHAIGSRTEDDFQHADIVLGVNVPGQKQGDLALGLNLNQVDTNDRNVPEWLNRMHSYMKRKPVAIVDVAYANGADPKLIPMLLKRLNWEELFGFAAWNTAGNSLGTVVSQTALHWLAEKRGMRNNEVRINQLILRLLDDYVYQSISRGKSRNQLNVVSFETLDEIVSPIFIKDATFFLDNWAQGWKIDEVYYPWDRTFEIGIHLRRKEEWK